VATILVIEDSEEVRRAIHRALTAAGHSVLDAANGRLGLDLLERSRVDVLVTDVLMPEADGIEVLRDAARLRRGLPVIVMSGGGRHMPAAIALSLASAFGASRVLYKPFRTKELLKCIDELLDAVGQQGASEV
jgi:CheY-like chemotaxis protein